MSENGFSTFNSERIKNRGVHLLLIANIPTFIHSTQYRVLMGFSFFIVTLRLECDGNDETRNRDNNVHICALTNCIYRFSEQTLLLAFGVDIFHSSSHLSITKYRNTSYFHIEPCHKTVV